MLYDVHGNLPALEAVLGDAQAARADAFVLGGDYALFGPWPAETLAALRELEPATWIRGNVDRWTAFPDQVAQDAGLSEAVKPAATSSATRPPTGWANSQSGSSLTAPCTATPRRTRT